jgi:hypothetical protein
VHAVHRMDITTHMDIIISVALPVTAVAAPPVTAATAAKLAKPVSARPVPAKPAPAKPAKHVAAQHPAKAAVINY